MRKKKNIPRPRNISRDIVVMPAERGVRDIGSWKSALRAADIGMRQKLYDLYTDILLDGIVTDAIAKRIEAITDREISFTVDGRRVEEMDELVDTTEFEALLEEIMWSRFWGISLDEFRFEPSFGFDSIPRKHIRPKEKVVTRRQYDQTGVSYRDDPMVIQWGRDDDYGLLLKIAPYVIYKRGGFGDWAQFTEIFGMPMRVGKYNSMDESSKRQLIQAFETMGSAPYVVVPKESDVDTTLMSGSQNGQLYDDFRGACNEEILITVLGQTMTTQNGASLSQSKVHLAVQEKKHSADRRFVTRQLNEKLLPLLEARGYPVKGGRFSFVDKKDELSIEEVIRLAPLMPIPVSWVRTTRGIPEPKEGEPVLRAEQPSNKSEVSENSENSEEKTDQKLQNSDRTLWQRIKSFFAEAPERTGAGTIRTSDGDTLDERVVKQVWNGEKDFSPELFRYFSEDLLKAVQTGFKGRSKGVRNADVEVTYNAPDDVFQTALELNVFHFSAAKTIAEIRALNQILQESKTYAEFRDKAAKVTGKFNNVWQRTEYDTAVLTAEAMDNYRRLASHPQLFPFWQYKTVEDDKVRPWHRALDGIILPCDDDLWDEIYPPNGWRCRCRVKGLQKSKVPEGSVERSRATVEKYKQSPEWKQIEAQGWDVNRCKLGKIFTENQMYIQRFPHQAERELIALTSDKWGLPSVAKLAKEAKEDIPLIEIKRKGCKKRWRHRTEAQRENKEIQYEIWDEYKGGYEKNDTITLKDYRDRDITLRFEDFEEHTTAKGGDNRIKYWKAMLQTLKEPDEVWINNHREGTAGKTGDFNVYCLIRYYHNVALCVNLQLEDNKIMLATWYPMPVDVTWTETVKQPDGTEKKVPKKKRKKIWDERRFGLLVYQKE